MQTLASNKTAAQRRRSPSIELKLQDVSRLFNPMDPSPLQERDLNDDVEEFIVGWMEEYPPNAQVTLRVHLEQWPADDPSNLVRTAIHNYFAYRASVKHQDFERLMRRGRTSLIIGIVFLLGCLVVSHLLLGGNESTWAGVGRESLAIAGWVAMWRPMEIYLYDWWPLRGSERNLEKLSRMPVEVVRGTTT
jgi:hypothetical protein